MEKNYVSEWKQTCFYVNLENRTYGVVINVKDIAKKNNIIHKFRQERKKQIEAWKSYWNELDKISKV